MTTDNHAHDAGETGHDSRLPSFTITRHSSLGPERAFQRLTAWERHAVFGTTVDVAPGPAGVGQTFTARTSMFGVGFDDVMEVTDFEPATDNAAGFCRISKRGPVLYGEATIEVSPAAKGCTVRWTETLFVGKGVVAQTSARIGSLVGPLIFGPLITLLLREE